MPRGLLNPRNARNPIRDAREEIMNYLERQSGGEIDVIHCEPKRKGLLIAVEGENRRRYLLCDLDLTGVDASIPDEPGSLSVHELENYTFDPEAKCGDDEALYAGFVSRGDLAVWLGREKHRKSNTILQFAISAALGRDYLGLKFVAGAPLKVVLIDFESKSGSLNQRYQSIVAAMKLSQEESERLKVNLTIIEVRRIRKSGRVFPKFPHKQKPELKQNELRFWEDLVAANPADLYIIDPLRTLHAADENDSTIETLLSEMQRVFRGAAVVAAHHMRKAGENNCTLMQDMRLWSDGARGSSAIKAHTDVIVLQERIIDEKGNEVVHLGAFLKDGPDIEPMQLMESDHLSFYWQVATVVPKYLRESFDALAKANILIKDRAKAAELIKQSTGVARATAYRHVEGLIRAGVLMEERGCLRLQKTKGC
jgi:hypothetical protein